MFFAVATLGDTFKTRVVNLKGGDQGQHHVILTLAGN